jgi:hypothetical protein
MPRIFDNIEEQLDEALRNTLAASVTLDTSVGYFNVRGWSALADAIDALPEGSPKVRLLIGMAERPDQELRQRLRVLGGDRPMDLQTADRLRSTVMQDLHSQLVWGLPTARDEATIRQLRRQAQCGGVQAAHVSRQPRPQHLLHFKPGAAKRVWGKSSWSNLGRQHKIARSLTKQSRTRSGDFAGYPLELSYQQLRTASFGLHGRQQ